MNTNWPDVFVVLIWCATVISGLGISAWLVITGHPWFALAVIIVAASISIKTGK